MIQRSIDLEFSNIVVKSDSNLLSGVPWNYFVYNGDSIMLAKVDSACELVKTCNFLRWVDRRVEVQEALKRFPNAFRVLFYPNDVG